MIDEQFLDEISQYQIDEGLRDYQEIHKQKIYKKWRETDSVLLQMPTGTGKTRLFVSIINDLQHYAIEHKTTINVLVVAHRKEIVDQISKELSSYALECTLINAENTDPHYVSKPICIASRQTLVRRLPQWKEHPFQLVIVDEAHHARAASYRKVLNLWSGSKILGVTATPYRMNGDGLSREFNELIVSPSIKQFIEAGWLSNYDYYSISNKSQIYLGLENVPSNTYGDYQIQGLWKYCKKDSIRSEIIGSYLKYAKGKKGIVYTVNKEHNYQLCAAFRKCGITACGIDDKTPAEVREKLVDDFRKGYISVLCNVNIFTEGFDCPDVEFIQLARPTLSLALYLQQVGRGLRIANNKVKVIFIDNVGLYNRFGLPADRREWGRYYVGNHPSEYGLQYIKRIDKNEIFTLANRDQDLSEGCENVELIESTGFNELEQETQKKYVDNFAPKLKPIIDSIFEINKRICNQYINEYAREEHLTFSSEVIENILDPCPNMTVKCDNIDFIGDKIKNEYKSIVRNNNIDYVEYQDWDDYAQYKMKFVKIIFQKKLDQAQSENMEKLNEFTANELKSYFELYYGVSHGMSKRLTRYCIEYSFNDKWDKIRKASYIKYYYET